MKREWNTPVAEELEIKNTEYNQQVTSTVDGYVYDAVTHEVLFIDGYMSGIAVR